MKLKSVAILLGILIILAIYPIYQLYALSHIQLQSYSLQKISLDKDLHFVVEGSGDLYNPSLIPVTIEEVRYAAYMNGEEMFNGTVPGKTIPAQSTETFTFSQKIAWVPDIETALEITSGKNMTVTLYGEADVSYLYFFTLTGKQEKSVDIAKLLKPMLEKQVAAISNSISNTLGMFFS